MANKSVTAAKGFLAGGVYSGVKKSGKPDLGVVVCPEGATAAAVFTTNQVYSAAVEVCRSHVKSGKIYAAVVNSGNANACTGKQGLQDAITMCQAAGRLLGVKPNQILLASTGIIGEKLAVDKVTAGIAQAAKKAASSVKGGTDFARAIMDHRQKTQTVSGLNKGREQRCCHRRDKQRGRV